MDRVPEDEIPIKLVVKSDYTGAFVPSVPGSKDISGVATPACLEKVEEASSELSDEDKPSRKDVLRYSKSPFRHRTL